MVAQRERSTEVRSPSAADRAPVAGRPDGAGEAVPTRVSTRDQAVDSPATHPLRRPGRRGRLVVPARLRIMAWVVLLLLMALATVVVVTRNLLVADAQRDAGAALLQETEEFLQAARDGVDQVTRQPFADGRDLMFNHIERQYTDEDEILLGVTVAGEILPQPGREPIALAGRDNRLTAIVDDPATTGILDTRDGRLRWSKVPIVTDGRPDGTFIVAYAIDEQIERIDETVRTLAVVSLIGLLLTAAAAYVVSGQILAPVNAVRRTAERISHDDLTERIDVAGNDDIAALSDQFNGMLDRLEQAFGTQRRFLDDASHELRTPITIIRGNLEFIEDDDPAERAEVVRLCTDELDRMSRIVEDLLLLAKAERPDFVVPQEVGLVDLTSDIDAKLRALGPRRWQLESIAEGDGVLDPQRVTQAVVALAHNAVQHTVDGGRIAFGSATDADEVRFWITDDGPGVHPEDARTIFQRFARGTNGTIRAQRTGAGLGLSIVTAIAEAHGGHVELYSVPGAGATFTVHLPQPHLREHPPTADDGSP